MESRSSESTRSGTVLYEFHEGVPYEGQLLKFTNLVKGFQHRWFILHPVAGTLAYYLDKNDNRSEAPRGAIYLGGAQVYPSDDDSRTFSVNPVKGDPFKLRAADAKGRQDWISRLRTVIHLHNEEIARNHPPLPPREEAGPATERIRPKVTLPSLNMADALASAREIVNYAHVTHDSLVKAVDRLPQPLSAQISGSSPPPPLTTLCPDVLALKATSLAALTSLQSCLEMVFQLGLAAEGKPRCRGVSSSSSQETSDAPPKSEKSFASTPAGDCVGKAASVKPPLGPPTEINHEEEGSDEEVTVSSPLASAPDPTHPSPPATPEGASIATVLGHVKLGADLTKVSLPSSILDRRSFLEFMADCLCNVDLFCRIYSCEAPQDEMKSVLSWYFSCFAASNLCFPAPPKKPFNPVLGETFHCSWKVMVDGSERVVRYTAEQVSHHPPVSCLSLTCPSLGLTFSCSLLLKAKFLGMAVGVSLIGSAVLTTPKDSYSLTFPSLYARSIVTQPWVEFGGEVGVVAQHSGWRSAITFHTKPFFGGRVHRVSGALRSPTGELCCKLSGTWDGTVEWEVTTEKQGDSQPLLCVSELSPKPRKRVRDLQKQDELESRRIWFNVAQALAEKDFNTADEHKKFLEQRQREIRQNEDERHAPRFFRQQGDTWIPISLNPSSA